MSRIDDGMSTVEYREYGSGPAIRITLPNQTRWTVAEHSTTPLNLESQGAIMDAARNAGYDFGSSMALIFVVQTPDINAVWNLGTAFAKMLGYNDLSNGTAWVSGFVQGITAGKTRLIDGNSPRASE